MEAFEAYFKTTVFVAPVSNLVMATREAAKYDLVVFQQKYYALSETLRHLPVEAILPQLVSNKVITFRQKEDILAESKPRNKVAELLDGPIKTSLDVGIVELFRTLLCVMRQFDEACAVVANDTLADLASNLSDAGKEEFEKDKRNLT